MKQPEIAPSISQINSIVKWWTTPNGQNGTIRGTFNLDLIFKLITIKSNKNEKQISIPRSI